MMTPEENNRLQGGLAAAYKLKRRIQGFWQDLDIKPPEVRVSVKYDPYRIEHRSDMVDGLPREVWRRG